MKTLKNLIVPCCTFMALFLTSCGSSKTLDTGINNQTQRVESTLKRNEYTLLDKDITFSIKNKKKYKKYSLDQLKNAAFMEAEKGAIKTGADGLLNPRYTVDQKGKRYTVTVYAKAYKLKSDNEYLDMENNLKHNPNSK